MLSIIAVIFLISCVASEQECVSPWIRNSSWKASPFHGALCNAPERDETAFAAHVGSIPSWLKGTLFRNVPAQYTFGVDDVRHWFDGMGMFHTLELDPNTNTIVSKSRFANTTSFEVMNATSEYDYTGFGTYPRPGPLESGPASLSDGRGIVTNNDVSIVELAGRFFATTDRAGFIEFDPHTLATLTSTHDFEFVDNLTTASARGLGLAHGPYDASTGEYFNYVSDAMMSVVGGPTTVYIYSINATAQFQNRSLPWARRTVGVVQTTNNTYAHSMGLTEHFVVWIEQRGITVSELDLAIGSTIMDAMHETSEASVMRIVDRASSTVHTVPMNQTEFGCMFHSGNTFEDNDGSIVYDMVSYPNCTGYKSLSMEGLLLRPDEIMPNGRFSRCRVAPGFGSASCGTILPHTYSSFPWYNKNFHKRPYRYAYTTDIARVRRATVQNTSWNTTATIEKIDLTTNRSVASYSRQNFLFTEALFIPQFPGNVDPDLEDSGALLTVAFNVETSLTDVIALNATNLEVLFVVALPFAIPLHFHGIFCGPVPDNSSEQQFCIWN